MRTHGYSQITGLDFDKGGTLFGIADTMANGALSSLVTINPTTAIGTVIGTIGTSPIRSLASGPAVPGPDTIPEPSTMLLLGSGLVGLIA